MSLPLLTERWVPLKPVAEQIRLEQSPARFKLVPAGRRSGKTERAKRRVVRAALRAKRRDARFGCGAPTYNQAKSIFWTDLKALVPKWALLKTPSESDLLIKLINGAEIQVFGMDKPQRVEGRPWDGIVLDEYGNMKPTAWTENVYPALSTLGHEGWAWLIGVPEGRNHYYDLVTKHRNDPEGIWDVFSWKSSEVLPSSTIEQAMRDLDELTFQQEYEASFVNFRGQAYYQFKETMHVRRVRDRYNPRGDLVVCFDFNVDPGVAVICQEVYFPQDPSPMPSLVDLDGQPLFTRLQRPAQSGTAVLGEIYIPVNSNTPAVIRKFISEWGKHEGNIFVYGDATGGARGTAQTEGSDWDIIRRELFKHFGRERVHLRVPEANPSERARVNAVNCRIMGGDGTVRLLVDGHHAPNVVKDLEGVRLLEGGSGEIDKKHDPKLTHLSDALGYYIVKQFPVHVRRPFITEAGVL
jgi:hypothetical protein